MFDTLTRAGASGAGSSYTIDRSLRLHASDSAALSRTPSSSGNRKTWTFSTWIKLAVIDTGSGHCIFSSKQDGSYNDVISITSDNKLSFKQENNNTTKQCYSTRLLRDTTGWYHIVVTQDTEESTAANRVKFWINGVQETLTGTFPNEDSSGNINWTKKHFIGATKASSGSAPAFEFHGYIAETHFIDGTALDASTFGQTDTDTNAWIPKEVSGVTYGTNGFYLKYSDNSDTTAGTLGADTSGNGNNYTPTGLSVSAGVGNDSFTDTPTNNHAVLNRLDPEPATLSNGCLDYSTAQAEDCSSSFGFTSGKWYAELTCGGDGQGSMVGIKNDINERMDGGDANTICAVTSSNAQYSQSSTAAVTTGGSWTTNDIIGIALDATNKTCDIYKNGSKIWGFTSFTVDGPYYFVFDRLTSGGSTVTHSINFGQRAFSHQVSTYNAVCAQNLPDPTIKDPTKHFGVLTYTGNEGATRTIADTDAVDFTPDFIWAKNRDATAWHIWADSSRGIDGKTLYSNRTEAEYDASGSGEHGHISAAANGGFVASDTDGSVGINLNNSGDKYVAWCWKGNGGTNSSNSDGSLTSTVQVNASAGFSMVKYTGTGSATTIGHGLGVTPDMIIVKALSRSDNWMVYHKTSGNTHHFQLNENDSETDFAAAWNDTSPTSSVFTVGSDSSVNGSTETYIAYVFSSVDGFSKVGFYNGNGADDGSFVYTGFKPAFAMMKDKTSAGEWSVYDNSRMPYNVMQKQIRADADDVENDHAVNRIDFLSNGWKMRDDDAGKNASRAYIYIAFAETPFKYATAR